MEENKLPKLQNTLARQMKDSLQNRKYYEKGNHIECEK